MSALPRERGHARALLERRRLGAPGRGLPQAFHRFRSHCAFGAFVAVASSQRRNASKMRWVLWATRSTASVARIIGREQLATEQDPRAYVLMGRNGPVHSCEILTRTETISQSVLERTRPRHDHDADKLPPHVRPLAAYASLQYPQYGVVCRVE